MIHRKLSTCLIVLSSVFALAGCGEDRTQSAAGTPPTSPSPEYQLATLQRGGYVAPSDPLVRQIGTQLDSLQRKTAADRASIASVCANTHDGMLKKGVSETNLSILTHVSGSMPDGLKNSSDHGETAITNFFAVYEVLRTR